MKTLKLLFILSIISLITSCSVGPQPIEYGSDSCYFCKMTIVDKIHGAEFITSKGKVYKFDALECMINTMRDFDTSQIASFLTNYYSEPEILIDATQATFLISENMPSPMGAFLTGFKDKNTAIAVADSKGGTIYNWEELINHLK